MMMSNDHSVVYDVQCVPIIYDVQCLSAGNGVQCVPIVYDVQ